MNHEKQIENQEIVQILQKSSAGPLINVMLNNPDCYTSSGRLNRSMLMRYLNLKREDVNKMIIDAENMKYLGS